MRIALLRTDLHPSIIGVYQSLVSGAATLARSLARSFALLPVVRGYTIAPLSPHPARNRRPRAGRAIPFNQPEITRPIATTARRVRARIRTRSRYSHGPRGGPRVSVCELTARPARILAIIE